GVVQVWRGALDDAIRSFETAIALAPDESVGFFNLGKALELRYRASRRYVQQLRSWVANETDRKDAIANYERHLSKSGPFERAGRPGEAQIILLEEYGGVVEQVEDVEVDGEVVSLSQAPLDAAVHGRDGRQAEVVDVVHEKDPLVAVAGHRHVAAEIRQRVTLVIDKA